MILFVAAFFSSSDAQEEWAGVVDKVADRDEWLIRGSYQLLPLYIVQVCRGGAEAVDAPRTSGTRRCIKC